MRQDKTIGTGMNPFRSFGRAGRVVLVAIVIAAAGGAAFRLLRPNDSVSTGTASSVHGHGASHPASTVTPTVVDPARARIKALGELEESRSQIARMKAQGIGEPAIQH